MKKHTDGQEDKIVEQNEEIEILKQNQEECVNVVKSNNTEEVAGDVDEKEGLEKENAKLDEYSKDTEVKIESELFEESRQNQEFEQKSRIKKAFGGKKKLILIGGVIAVAAIFLIIFATQDCLNVNSYTVDIGEDVYVSLESLVDEEHTNVDLESLEINHPFGDENKYTINSEGLVKTNGLDYLDAGEYEIEVYYPKKDISKISKITVVDNNAPIFVDFADEVEITVGESPNWDLYYNVEDKSLVEIDVTDGVFDPNLEGTYNVVITATDTSGNSTDHEGKIKVKEKNYGDIAGYEAAIRQIFSDSGGSGNLLKMEYDKHSETLTIVYELEGTALVYAVSEEYRETIKANVIEIAESLQMMSYQYAIPTKHFDVSLANDRNTQNILFRVRDGVLISEPKID